MVNEAGHAGKAGFFSSEAWKNMVPMYNRSRAILNGTIIFVQLDF